MRRFNSSSWQGYDDVECAISKFSVPISRTVDVISSQVDMPVEMISGLPVAFFLLSRFVSVSDAEAALKHGVSNCAIKSTDGSSQHEANQWISFSRQYLSISEYSFSVNST